MTVLEKIYPDHKIIGLPEIFVKNVGWYDTLVHNEKEIKIIAKRETDGIGRKIERMCILLEDLDGFRKRADFLPKEII